MIFRIADLFCGAGGTSAGAVEALEHLGFKVELTAVNHWPVAIDTHEANHPGARHLCTGIDSVNPLDYFARGELDMLWASPECTHHSIARGGKPINDQSRSTAWHVLNWAEKLEPNYVLLENVPEWVTWGPLDENNRPIPSLKGKIFRAMIAGYRAIGYKLVHGLHCAADYGDPTTRTRLFVVMVKGKSKLTGKKLRVVLPNPTHSQTPDMFASRRWTPAKDIIDWEIEGQSIFSRKRPLSEKTMKRIEAGLRKFGLKGFIIPNFGEREGQEPRTHDLEAPAPTVTSHGAGGLIQPFIVKTANGESRAGEHTRSKAIAEPMPTVTGSNDFALIEPHLLPQQSAGALRPISQPCPTVSTAGAIGFVQPFLISYYGSSLAQSVDEPLDTVTCKDRHALALPVVEIDGQRFRLDIRFRMLQPHELALAQGFQKGYRFSGTKTDQVKQIGNAVPRRMARALVAAVVSQNADVSALVDAEENAGRKKEAA